MQTKIGLFIYLILISFNNIMIRGVTQSNYIQQILRVLFLFWQQQLAFIRFDSFSGLNFKQKQMVNE